MNNSTILRIKPESDDIKTMYKNHGHFHVGDAGLDVFTKETIVFKPRETKRIHFGISCELIKDNRNCSYYLYPRSSISKTPLRMSNSVGIIDAGYRGEIMASCDNISDKEYIVKKGTRLFQLCNPCLEPFDIEIVEGLTDSSRGTCGFGSTN